MRLSTLLPVLPALVHAISTTFTIPASPLIPHPATLPANTVLHLTASGYDKAIPISPQSTFTVHNLTKGVSYLVETYAFPYIFFPVRLDVFADGSTQATVNFRENSWSHRGEVLRRNARGEYELRAAVKREFYYKREGFSPKQLLMNPMILIAVVSLFALVMIPKIIDNMDPEIKAEFEAQQRNTLMAGATNGFDIAGMLAGTSAGGPAAGAAGQKQAVGGASGGGGKGKGKRK